MSNCAKGGAEKVNLSRCAGVLTQVCPCTVLVITLVLISQSVRIISIEHFASFLRVIVVTVCV